MNQPASLQERIRHAWETVQEVEKRCEQEELSRERDDYASFVARLPLTIMINGLGQALAALRSSYRPGETDQKEPRAWLWKNLSGWLCRNHPLAPYPGATDLLQAVMDHGPDRYRRAMTEAMNWLFWHKRFAEAILKDRNLHADHRFRVASTKVQTGLIRKLPLYKPTDDRIHLPKKRPSAGNTGLWYEKFCNEWMYDPGSDRWYLSRRKMDWIRSVTGTVGNADLLREALERTEDIVRANGGLLLYTKTASRFATGLGRSHPTENGFTWHHTLGVPYLIGSSIKGLVRAWASEWIQADPRDINRIFGPDTRETRGHPHSGSVLFLDALPAQPPTLEMDVISVHHLGYYSAKDKKKSPPHDWSSPNVTPFLVVARDQPFVFALLPRSRREQDLRDLYRVHGWLQQALEWSGAGAKTAVGYGRFTVDAAKQEVWEKSLQTQEHVG
ncbi:type III-B CRISPR module RAMP protein Cmr6 [Staphylospora marina]|uniref:type III-B CRISPR module RAMP protein Cmr6 n=1 Tax=Staphylospora marina TaxID=2490858 RepID=UPI0013DE6C4F|nr:type III-B CRISPR module RAMP protein Cmr6 [Staphylospora marina]